MYAGTTTQPDFSMINPKMILHGMVLSLHSLNFVDVVFYFLIVSSPASPFSKKP